MTHDRRSYVIGAPTAALAVLAFINLFSYLDRYVVSALIEPLKQAGLGLSDANLGSLMSGFLIVYTLLAPLFGALGDRRSRPRLIAVGVGCWSIATAVSGFAFNYLSLFIARACVGVGEAAYVTIAPSLLSDYFPRRLRARVMAVFFCAIPVGSALGYIVGGSVNQLYGWRAAFFVAGVPGLLLAGLCLALRDPPRGGQDATGLPSGAHNAPDTGAREGATSDSAAMPLSAVARETWATYTRLLRDKPYRLTVLGYAAYTFAVGGLAVWMPAFLQRVRAVPADQATVSFGAIVVATGLVGTFVGGWLGDYFAKRSPRAYLYLSALATLAAAPLVWLALTSVSHASYTVFMVAGQLCLFLSTGPINAAIVNLVQPSERATAIALSVFAIHLLGDALSPFLIGILSDIFGLQNAVRIVPVAVLIGGLVWLWAARTQQTSLPSNPRIEPHGEPDATGRPRSVIIRN